MILYLIYRRTRYSSNIEILLCIIIIKLLIQFSYLYNKHREISKEIQTKNMLGKVMVGLFHRFLLLFTKSKILLYLFIDDQVEILGISDTNNTNEDFCTFQIMSYNLNN